MNKRNRNIMDKGFGDEVLSERIRTEILFTLPYGSISVPDVDLGGDFLFCAARVPCESFYERRYWASDGPKPSDEDPGVFIVPVCIRPSDLELCDNWARICRGKFITTRSGVIVLDTSNVFAWEGYSNSCARDYNYDRRRLDKSAKELSLLFRGYDMITGDMYRSKYCK